MFTLASFHTTYFCLFLDKYPIIISLNKERGGLGLMVFNDTFNNISVTSWQSVLLVEETGVPGENHRPVAGH